MGRGIPGFECPTAFFYCQTFLPKR